MSSDPEPGAMSSAQSAELAQHLARAAESQLPLASALMALAEEIPSPPVARALRKLSGHLSQGEPLAAAVGAVGLPRHLQGIILAGVASGDLAKALMAYADHRRNVAAVRHQLILHSLYPCVVVALMALVVLGAAWLAAGPAQEFFEDFGVELPWATRAMIGLGNGMMFVAGGVLAALATYLLVGPGRWRGASKRVPLYGPIWRWMGQAEFCQLLGLLVEQQLPLPQALRLTGAGLDDPSLCAASLQLAGEVERGASLSSAIASQRRFAPTLSPWLAASERASALAGGLKTAAELFQARVQSQIELLKIVLPPIMLVVVGWGVTFVAVALIYPAVSLIRDLTY